MWLVERRAQRPGASSYLLPFSAAHTRKEARERFYRSRLGHLEAGDPRRAELQARLFAQEKRREFVFVCHWLPVSRRVN
ncbi:MAG: hypothetical protein QM817_10435 [Archangium sp.]